MKQISKEQVLDYEEFEKLPNHVKSYAKELERRVEDWITKKWQSG